MRPVERRFLEGRERRTRRAREAGLERHRLAYVYFLNRPEERVGLGELTPEMAVTADACRRHRAEYVGLTMAEADRSFGTVLEVAQKLAAGTRAGEGDESHAG